MIATILLAAVVSSTAPVERAATAIQVAVGPKIDGDLSDAAWMLAETTGAFTQQWPEPGKSPLAPTEVRIVYDQDAIYFAFHCRDPDPGGIVARLTRRDYDSASDAVTIDLDPEAGHTRAFHFEVSAAGVLRDGIRTGDSAISFDWDAIWRAAVRQTKDGWDAEIAIPFSALRYDAGRQVPWRMELRRYVSRRNETDAWADIPQNVQGELFRYGRLDGLQHLPATHSILLNPFVTGKLQWQYTPSSVGGPNGLMPVANTGLDATFGVTSGLTLQLSVLPDFGQVEADPAVLNLSTFELHLDEKRQFFLQGGDLFQIPDAWGNALGYQLFYSRRLGATPDAPTLPTGATQVQLPDPAPIWGAAKLSGRIGDRLTIALLDGVTAQESAPIRLATGAVENQELAPLSNFLVARLRAPVGAGFTTGVTITDVARDERGGSMVLQGLCPDGGAPGADGRCTHDAQAAAADVLWRSRDGAYAASALLLGGRVSSGPSRMLLDGTWINPGDTGFGGRAQISRMSGNIIGNISFETMSPKLDLNDAGYQPQQNYRSEGGDIAWRTWSAGPTSSTNIDLGVSETDSWKGLLLGRAVWASESATFRSQWSAGLNEGAWQEAYDNREAGDGTPVQRPPGGWGTIWANSNPTQPFTLGGWSSAHSTWRGYGVGGGLNLNARFLNRFELSFAPQASWQTGDPRHVDTLGTAPATDYLFGLQDAFSTSTTLRSTVTFTPSLTLEGYAQLFFSAIRYTELYSVLPTPDLLLSNYTTTNGDPHAYDSRNAILNVSLVFRWEYLPGSILYLVYTHSTNGGVLPLATGPDGIVLPARSIDWNALQHGQTEDVLLAKLSYSWGR
jgi:hypothetical protein